MKFNYKNNVIFICFLSIVLALLLYGFRLIDAVIFPNCVLLFFIAVLMILLPTILLNIIPWKWKISAIIVSFAFATINWIVASYTSYYDGVASNLYNEANILYTSTATILNNDITDDEKRKQLKRKNKSPSFPTMCLFNRPVVILCHFRRN